MAPGCLRALLLHVCIVLAACTAATPEQLLSQARSALAAGERRTAEIHLKNLLQQHSDNAAGRQLLGELLLQNGDFVGAEQNLRLALDLGADASVALLNSLIPQRKFNEALELISSKGLPRTDNERVEVVLLQAAAYRGLGQPEKAVETYRAALAVDPRSPDLRTDLATTLFGMGKAEEGRELVKAVLDDAPNYAPALLARGNLESAGGQRTAAEATFQQVVDQEAASGATRGARYSVAMARLIELQVALGKVDVAARNADAFMALDGNSLLARFSKALIEVEQNNLESAEQRLEALVAAAPKYWPAYRLLGAVNIRQEQLGQATMYLRTVVNNDPADSAARVQLAELYVQRGDLDSARTLMGAASGAANDALFLAFAGGVSQRAGLQQQAAQYFDQSEQRTSSSVQELVSLSALYASSGEFDRAIRLLQGSSSAGAQNRQISDYLLALVYMRQGDLKAADEVATRLQQQQGGAAWTLNLRGVIALVRGDVAGAQTLFSKSLELEPRNAVASLNMARVAVAEKDAPRAEKYLRQTLEVEPAQPLALIGLAQFAMGRRDFEAARALLDRMPESRARTRGEAELSARQGKFEDSAQLYDQLYAQEPSQEIALLGYDSARRAGRPNADAQLLRWHAEHPKDKQTNLVLASVALEKNELARAQSLYEDIVAVDPNQVTAINNLAWLYGERKDPRATQFGERALAAEPNNPAVADTVGWLYVRGGDAARGLPLLERAAKALPAERDVNFHLAVALADTGGSARAIQILEGLTGDGREFRSRAEAVTRLNDLRRRTP